MVLALCGHSMMFLIRGNILMRRSIGKKGEKGERRKL